MQGLFNTNLFIEYLQVSLSFNLLYSNRIHMIDARSHIGDSCLQISRATVLYSRVTEKLISGREINIQVLT